MVINHLLNGMILQVTKRISGGEFVLGPESSFPMTDPMGLLSNGHESHIRPTKWAMKKGPLVGLGYIGDEILPSYIGIIMSYYYKNPY